MAGAGVLLIGALMLVACSDLGRDADSPTRAPTRAASTPTPGGPTTQPGDIPEELREILDRVAELRELEAPPSIDAELIARSELPALLETLITEEDMEYFAETTTLYRLLGYIANDEDYFDIYMSFGADGILGLYAPSEKKLWVVYEDGRSADWGSLSRQAEETLAHELVHVLQDYHFDIGTRSLELGSDLDRGLAYSVVIEGDASAHDSLYAQEYLSVAPMPFAGGLMFMRADLMQAGVPPAVLRTLFFPYTAGADFIADVRREYGTERINELLLEPMKATTYVFRPHLLEEGWEPEEVMLPNIASLLGSGWAVESRGQFGEFSLGNYLRGQLTRADAEEAAWGWEGDAYVVYRNQAVTVATFRVVFESVAEAFEFYDAHGRYLARAGEEEDVGLSGGRRYYRLADGDAVVTFAPEGREVTFVIGSAPAIADHAASMLLQ